MYKHKTHQALWEIPNTRKLDKLLSLYNTWSIKWNLQIILGLSIKKTTSHLNLYGNSSGKKFQWNIASQYKWNTELHEWPSRKMYSCQLAHFSHTPGSVKNKINYHNPKNINRITKYYAKENIFSLKFILPCLWHLLDL